MAVVSYSFITKKFLLEATAGGAMPGLTAGGAREWVIAGNPPLDLSSGEMEGFDVGADGVRGGPLAAEPNPFRQEPQ